MFNQEEVKQTTLAHYTYLALNPAWKAHAWHRVQELELDKSGLWSGIANELKQTMLRL
jgi:hypothetical protein